MNKDNNKKEQVQGHDNCCGHHDHDHDNCCGHDHGKQDHAYEEGIELDTIFLEFEDPNEPDQSVEIECGVLGVFDHEDKEYIAIVIPEGNGEDLNDDIYIYQYSEDEEGQPILENIDDDDEFDQVADQFNQIFLID